jgi:hypothetical protein
MLAIDRPEPLPIKDLTRFNGFALLAWDFNPRWAMRSSIRLMRHNKTKHIREVIMNLMPVYEKWEAEKIAEGEHRGEQSKGIAIARRMLTRGIPIAEIAELTELTILQIQSIQVEDPQK